MYIAGNLVLDTLQQRSSYLTDIGALNAYEVQFVPAIAPGYTDGLYVTFKAGTTNTGACTLQVDTNAPVPIVKSVNQSMGDEDILAGQIISVVYDAGQNVFQVLDNPEKVALPFSTFLIDGGQIAWQQNYDYIVAADDYVILGTQYHADQTPITLAAADPFLDRIDLVVSTTSNTTVVITGMAATNPQLPSYDPATQIPLSFITVNAGTTVPNCAALTPIYRDNAGTPTEWATVSSDAIMMNPNSTNLPRTGTKNIEGTVVASGNTLTFTPLSPFNSSNATALQLYIRSKGSWGTTANGHRISVTVNNSGGQVGNPVIIPPRGDFGFDSVNTTTYQLIYIDLGRFAFPSPPVITSIVFTMAGSDGVMGWHIDDISVAQNCIVQASPTPLTFNNAITQSGNLVQLGGKLVKDTLIQAFGFRLFFSGNTVNDYPFQFALASLEGTTGLYSWRSTGAANVSEPDHNNTVRMGVGYTSKLLTHSPSNTVGYLNDKIGYLLTVNGLPNETTSWTIDNPNSKVGGLLFHTLDSSYTDFLTIFGKHPTTNTGDIIVTTGTAFESYRIATFHDDGAFTLWKYGVGTFTDTPAFALGVKADGSVIEFTPGGGSLRFGVAGEDDTATQTRAFDTNGFSLSINGATESVAAAGFIRSTYSGTVSAFSEVYNAIFTNNATGGPGLAGGVYGTSVGTYGAGIRGTSTATNGIAGIFDNSSIGGTGILGVTGTTFAIADIANLIGTGPQSSGIFVKEAATDSSIASALAVLGIYDSSLADGIGVSFDFYLNHPSNFNTRLSNQLVSKWTTSNDPTRTSEFDILGVYNAATYTIASLSPTGSSITTDDGTLMSISDGGTFQLGGSSMQVGGNPTSMTVGNPLGTEVLIREGADHDIIGYWNGNIGLLINGASGPDTGIFSLGDYGGAANSNAIILIDGSSTAFFRIAGYSGATNGNVLRLADHTTGQVNWTALGIDDVLAVGQSLTASRTITLNGNTLFILGTNPTINISDNAGSNTISLYTQDGANSNYWSTVTMNADHTSLNNTSVGFVATANTVTNGVNIYPRYVEINNGGSNFLRLSYTTTPANSTDNVLPNETLCADDSFLYYRTSGGTWVKMPWQTF